MNRFKKFMGHIKNKDWKATAEECKRRRISDARKDEIKKLLIDAAAAAP